LLDRFVEVMPAGISTLVPATWTSYDVVSVDAAVTLIEVGEEEDRPLALLASDNDIPRTLLRLKHLRASAFVGIFRILVQAD
jgi:hypothetical protein